MELRGIVYILSNMRNTTLYIGVTRDLRRRVAEHKLHINKGFTSKYNVDKLVYFEVYDRLEDGIRREKQLKNWQRAWKEKLINGINPSWKDLTEEIGVTVEFLNSVKKAYECGQYSPHSALDAEFGDSGSSPE
ncbi:MAG: GIY-YIG nuclease family protein [Bacteroidales bacterium]|nr:GIY-YIG nuclease family protein [Bacteroidales bacterium]